MIAPRAKRIAPTISHVGVDKGYTGQAVTIAAAKAGVTVDVVSGPKPGHGFLVRPRRWADPGRAWCHQNQESQTTLAASP
ncbi:hypothetical protein [Candidatus Mycobacterium methanotrophicum]|uniref:Transposase IS4-like domain-containing protein n=1 Tax=Candidatus Mycobacterium methanotrophicum TaxID=2943498 RepID=A0ABY4QS45_9MYCO|nr:hypothetical protein [Candidatus Mycobacterium methanotrophicum]UQX12558.1 hypothetical protein M5I08_10225 [Candidatus Mycobacterium methanotrophicum]